MVDLKFTINSLEWLDEHMGNLVSNNGVEVGGGIPRVVLGYETGDITILVDLLVAGTKNTENPLSYEDAEKMVDNIPTLEELEEFYDQVFTLFKKTPAVMFQMKKLRLDKAMEEMKNEA